MESVSNELLPLLARAAELRATGVSWTKIAEELGRGVETCRHWPGRFPETWRRLYRDAVADRAAECGAEAHQSLRMLVRSADLGVRLRAAQMLLRSWENQMDREDRATRPDPAKFDVELVEFANYVKGLADEQLAGHIAEFLASRPSVAVGTPPGADDPPGTVEPR